MSKITVLLGKDEYCVLHDYMSKMGMLFMNEELMKQGVQHFEIPINCSKALGVITVKLNKTLQVASE